MKKKLYNQPEIIVNHWALIHALCTSGMYGGDSTGVGDPGDDVIVN